MILEAAITIQVYPDSIRTTLTIFFNPETDTKNKVFSNDDYFFLKQNEINEAIGYKGGRCNYISEKTIRAQCDGYYYNFVKLSDCYEYLCEIPATGKRRENAKKFRGFIERLSEIIINSYNPIDSIKEKYETVDIKKLNISHSPENTDSKRLSELQGQIKQKDYEIEILKKQIYCINELIEKLTKDVFETLNNNDEEVNTCR